jgi:hypothetical protein
MVPELDPGLLTPGGIGVAVTFLLGILKRKISSDRLRFLAAIVLSALVGIGWAVWSLHTAGEPITAGTLVSNAVVIWVSSLGVYNAWKYKLGLADK